MSRGPYAGRGLIGMILILGLGILLGRSIPTGANPSAGAEARLDQSAVLGKFEYRNTAESFRGGEAKAVMGELRLDLREATMEADEAVIEVTVVMGHMVIRVPDNWTILAENETVLGETDNRAEFGPEQDKRLVLRGDVVMGQLEIRN